MRGAALITLAIAGCGGGVVAAAASDGGADAASDAGDRSNVTPPRPAPTDPPPPPPEAGPTMCRCDPADLSAFPFPEAAQKDGIPPAATGGVIEPGSLWMATSETTWWVDGGAPDAAVAPPYKWHFAFTDGGLRLDTNVGCSVGTAVTSGTTVDHRSLCQSSLGDPSTVWAYSVEDGGLRLVSTCASCVANIELVLQRR